MTTSSRDTKLHDVCDPWSGAFGAPYERVFEPEFLAGLDEFADEYITYGRHMAGDGPGSVPPATPAQIAAGAIPGMQPHLGTIPEQRKATAAWDNRENKIIAKLRKHCLSTARQSRHYLVKTYQ